MGSRISGLLILPLLAGCLGGGNKGGGAMVVTDDHNWSYTVTVDFDSVDLEQGADSTIDWSALTVDMRGNAVTGPDEVELVRLVELSLDQAAVLEGVAAGTITQQDIISPWEYATGSGDASCQMTDFSVSGNYFDPADSELGFVTRGTSSWLASVWRTNVKLGQAEILSSVFLVPSTSSSTTSYSFSDSTADLGFVADLHSGASPTVSAGASQYTLDWSGVTLDAGGKEFDELKATKLFIAHLPDAGSATELEDSLLTSLNQADTWLLDVYGETDAVLNQASSPESGGFFEGFTTDGVWVVGVLDPSGNEPAPYFLTVVTVN